MEFKLSQELYRIFARIEIRQWSGTRQHVECGKQRGRSVALVLTINADDHPLMNHFHKPTDEKRTVVILPPDRYQDWLEAPAEHSMEFMKWNPTEDLHAVAVK